MVPAIVPPLHVPAQAAEPVTLVLACQGTKTVTVKDAKPEPVSMNIIVNFAARTVTGPPLDGYYVTTEFDDLHISFIGMRAQWTIDGSIDRMTGDMYAALKNAFDPKWSQVLALKCRPTQRVF
jgi:hypothetical protein